jgi:hypothetical protein
VLYSSLLSVSYPEVLASAPCWASSIHSLLCMQHKHVLWTQVLLWLHLVILYAAQLQHRKLHGANVALPSPSPFPPKSIFIHHAVICYSIKLRKIFLDVHIKFCLDLLQNMKWRKDRHSQAESVQWYQKCAFLFSVLQSTKLTVCTTCYSIQRLHISFLDAINLCHIMKQSYTCHSPR